MSVTIPIATTPDVLDGKPRIEGTRVGVHHVGNLVREQGWGEAAVADELDLTADEVTAALEYYDSHLEEMADLMADAQGTYGQLLASSRASE